MPNLTAHAEGGQLASAALALLLIAAGPALAQTSAEVQRPPGATVEAPPPVPAEPLLAEVRRQLAEPARGAVDRGDRAALAEFYAARDTVMFVSASGFNARARNAMDELAKADDWGLSASAYERPQLAAGEVAPAQLADAEIKLGLAVLKYARHARGGRTDPGSISKNFDQKPALRDPKVVLAAVAATDAPGKYLTSLHPQHEQFQRLREALVKVRAGGTTAAKPAEPAKPDAVSLPEGPTLKLGVQHPHVALLRQRLGLAMPAGAESIFDLEVQDAVRKFQQDKGIQPSGMLTPRTRLALNGGPPQAKPAAPTGSELQRLIVNMERWRWMPEDMGEFHVWDNVPEYQTRVVKKGQVVHQAKIIVGKVENQTPVFSASMRYVVFHPEWGVPDSIKVKEILPYLRPSGGDFFSFFGGGTDTRVLQRHNLKVSYNGRPVDASTVNWSEVDIKRFTFIQPAGASNVLGVVKFRFPNKHDVYMHDTPQRELFTKEVRTFSHGCIRVQNPGRLAEILLAEDKGWSSAQVQGMLAQGYNNEVELTKQIPVHVTYFTAVAGEDGQIRHTADVYGHDTRVTLALAGRALPPEAGGPVGEDAGAGKQAKKAKRRPVNDNLW